ncbi:unnamed protein product [Urochloa humidicola]
MAPLPFLFHLPAFIYPHRCFLLQSPSSVHAATPKGSKRGCSGGGRLSPRRRSGPWCRPLGPRLVRRRGQGTARGHGRGHQIHEAGVLSVAVRTELSQLIWIGAGGPRWGATPTDAAVDVFHSGRRRGRRHRRSAKGPRRPPPSTRSCSGRRHGRHPRGFAPAAAAKGLLRDSATEGAGREPTRILRPLLQVDVAHVLRKKSNKVERIHDHLTPSMPPTGRCDSAWRIQKVFEACKRSSV